MTSRRSRGSELQSRDRCPTAACGSSQSSARRSLAVQEEHRSRGIGGRLLTAVEDWARGNGAELITTDTNLRNNLGAVEFYERNGYERQAVILRKSLA